MTNLVHTLAGRVVGTVESVSADSISVLLDPEAPRTTALNTGTPIGFPRVNGYMLIPSENGSTVCIVSSVHVERRRIPDRSGRRDVGLVDLPLPSRVMKLTPIGTLSARSAEGELSFTVRRGVDVFPSVGDSVHLPGQSQLQVIVEGEDKGSTGRILLGHCPTAGHAPVHVDPDKLFGRHLAVLGNTGAGKSCSVAGLIRWSLEAAGNARSEVAPSDSEISEGDEVSEGDDVPEGDDAPNARFIILDPNGEYARAFEDLKVRLFSVEPERGGIEGKQLAVPAWLWNGAEWAAFTGAAPGVQRPLLFEALRRLRANLGSPNQLETKARGRIKRYRSRISVLIQAEDHMRPGKREGVAQVLLNIAKDFQGLTEDPECADGNLRELLEQVAGEAARIEVAARQRQRPESPDSYWHDDFAESDLEHVRDLLQNAGEAVSLEGAHGPLDEDTPQWFPLEELPDYVDALAADSSGRDIAQWVDTLNLRIRGLLSKGRLASVLQPTDSDALTLADWLANYVGADHAENGPIAIIDLSLLPSEVTHIVVSVLGRMIFEAVQRYRRKEGKELPTTLVLEEAHTFVHRDLAGESAPPAARECASVFERIAREGRKFGLGLVVASQRPSEVSPTVLSQCNTFLLHRLVNDRDQDLVRRMVPDGLGSLLRELPSLPTRRAMLLGWAVPTPTLVEVQEIIEDHRPHSPDPAFWAVWTGQEERKVDWVGIARRWQKLDAEDAVDLEES